MKTLFKNILVLAVMLGTLTSYANTTLEVLPTYNSVKQGNSITVTDAEGAIIYSSLINFDGNITSLYDFSQLKDGIYNIEVNKDFVIEITTIEIKDNIVNYINPKSKKIYKPIFRIKDENLLISKMALDSPEMEIELYYDNELIHTETIKGSEVLNRAYRFDKTYRGEYSAIVRTNNRVFIKNFRI